MGLEFYSIYNWVKVLHISFVVAWMAGLLYLPRLFVYHQENEKEVKITTVFKVMERRLYFYIMNPAMVLVWCSGLYLGYIIGFDLWLIIKMSFVFGLTVYHLLLGLHLKNFKNQKQKLSSKYFRIINEIPTILLIIIVFVVVFKPL